LVASEEQDDYSGEERKDDLVYGNNRLSSLITIIYTYVGFKDKVFNSSSQEIKALLWQKYKEWFKNL